MKPLSKYFLVTLLAVGLPLSLAAQQMDVVGAEAGDREFTLSGGGINDHRFDDLQFGLNGSWGWYPAHTNQLLWSVRQSMNFFDGRDRSFSWDGSTRFAGDWHFQTGTATRPFVGASIGAIYGRNVRESFTAGLEGGFKHYILPKTFVLGMAEYVWNFRSGREFDRFRRGQFIYNVGMGVNF